jgi:hypothetical protein
MESGVLTQIRRSVAIAFVQAGAAIPGCDDAESGAALAQALLQDIEAPAGLLGRSSAKLLSLFSSGALGEARRTSAHRLMFLAKSAALFDKFIGLHAA